MQGRIIDTTLTEACVSLDNGETMHVSLSKLPRNIKVGDHITVPMNTTSSLTNNKLVDFF